MFTTNEEATAQEVKHFLMRHLIAQKGHGIAIEEFTYGGFICDVLSTTRSGYSHEWEVKLSRADLKSEIDCIERVLDGSHANLDGLQRRNMPKIEKHECNLLRSYKHTKRPCMFSFVVPEELYEYANGVIPKTNLYGLCTFRRYKDEGKVWYQFWFRLPAQKIHKDRFAAYAEVARSIMFKHYWRSALT